MLLLLLLLLLLLFKVNPANCVGFKLHLTHMDTVGCVSIQNHCPLIPPTQSPLGVGSASDDLSRFVERILKGRKTQLNLDKVLQRPTAKRAKERERDHKTATTPGDEM